MQGHSKLSLTDFHGLNNQLQSTKDELQKVHKENQVLKKKVFDLEERVESESLKNKKAIEGFSKKAASMEQHFMMEMAELKKASGLLN